MSERQRRGQVEQFKHLSDEAIQRSLKEKHLFSERPEVYSTSFRCKPVKDATSPNVNDRLILIARGAYYDVVHQGQSIARLEGNGARSLLEAQQVDPRSGSFLQAVVAKTPGRSGYFDIRLQSSTKEYG